MTPEEQVARLEQVVEDTFDEVRCRLTKEVFDEEVAWQCQHGPDPSVDRPGAYLLAWLVESEQMLDWMRIQHREGRLAQTPTDEAPY